MPRLNPQWIENNNAEVAADQTSLEAARKFLAEVESCMRARQRNAKFTQTQEAFGEVIKYLADADSELRYGLTAVEREIRREDAA